MHRKEASYLTRRQRLPMSDTAPKDQHALLGHRPTPASRQPKSRECVFEFVRERDHTRWRCELVDDDRRVDPAE
jgi:hypothetical protein